MRSLRGGQRVPTLPRASYDNPPKPLVHLGHALRSLREEKGMKQIELGAAADATESQVSDIERARNNPGWLLVVRLLAGLGATVGDLADAYARAERGELGE